jgi:AcrR family transcriptional regulator
MGIDERRAREREQRRGEIIGAAWSVAERLGWASFSVERVAEEAELGRATVYGYFDSLEALVTELARRALSDFSERLAKADGLAEAFDVPVRLSKARPAAYDLLFPSFQDPRPAFSSAELRDIREQARQHVARLLRLASKSRASLPEDKRSAEAFLAAISMAATLVPELKESTTLRRRWQEFCLREAETEGEQPPAESAGGKRR